MLVIFSVISFSVKRIHVQSVPNVSINPLVSSALNVSMVTKGTQLKESGTSLQGIISRLVILLSFIFLN